MQYYHGKKAHQHLQAASGTISKIEQKYGISIK